MFSQKTDTVTFLFDSVIPHTVRMEIVADTLDRLDSTSRLPPIKKIDTLPPDDSSDLYCRKVSFSKEFCICAILSFPSARETLELGLKIHRSRDFSRRTILVSAKPPSKLDKVLLHFTPHLDKARVATFFAGLATVGPFTRFAFGAIAATFGVLSFLAVKRSIQNWKGPGV